MKILQISHQLPYPPDSGGKMLIFNIIRRLSEAGHEVQLLALSNQQQNEGEKQLAEYCKLVTLHNDSANYLIPMVLNLFSPYPYNLSKYHKPEFLELVEAAVRSFKPDIVHCEQLHVAYVGIHIRRVFKIPVILREQNVESTIMYRFASIQKNPLRKFYAFHQYRKLYKYEKKMCAEVDLCIPITSVDEHRLQEMNPNCKTHVVPAGVDTAFFYPLAAIKEYDCSIVHVGSMNWLPNIDGMLWFVKNVFPRIKKALPLARLYIVGGNPPHEISSLASQDIIVTGYVDDVREYFAKAAVSIVPLRIGGGMRIKILDSLAMGKAVVSTSIGCEGIDVEDGKNILIADTPEQFAAQVIKVLQTPGLRERLGDSGLKLVQDKYTWESVINNLLQAYNEAQRCLPLL